MITPNVLKALGFKKQSFRARGSRTTWYQRNLSVYYDPKINTDAQLVHALVLAIRQFRLAGEPNMSTNFILDVDDTNAYSVFRASHEKYHSAILGKGLTRCKKNKHIG